MFTITLQLLLLLLCSISYLYSCCLPHETGTDLCQTTTPYLLHCYTISLGKLFVDFRVTGGPGQPWLVLVFPDTPTSPYTPRVLGLVWFFFCNNFNWIQPSSKGYTLLENKAISLITCLTSAVHMGQCQRAAPSWQGSCMAHSAPASLQNLSVQGH